MRIELTKLTDDQHRLRITRADGTSEEALLETRSFLIHDLVHYAVEAEAKIEDGFWGLLANGVTMAKLSDRTMMSNMASNPISPGIVLAESLVGPMQSLVQGRLDPKIFLEHGHRMAPEIVSRDFIDRVRARFRSLQGHWRATPFHQTMKLCWPPEFDSESDSDSDSKT
jgi:hypothetical protein